jgi:type IV fimbrial biogenesis protein FimT
MTRRQGGFNLIELIVAMLIMAILLGLGLPAYRVYLANQKLHAAVEVFMTGIHAARAEAITRNQRVEFLLTDAEPAAGATLASLADTTNLSATGRTWIIRAVNATTPVTYSFVEGKFGGEGTGGGTAATSPIIIGACKANADGTIPAGVSSIIFDGLGTPSNIAAPPACFQFRYDNPANEASLACATEPATLTGPVQGGAIRCREVRVQRGGQARTCDPAIRSDDLGDSRNCS